MLTNGKKTLLYIEFCVFGFFCSGWKKILENCTNDKDRTIDTRQDRFISDDRKIK